MTSLKRNTKLLWIALLGLAAGLVSVEVGLRLCGAVDFPTYSVDGGIGYIAMPNQAGNFLHKNTWAFNDRSMGTDTPWQPGARPNILLIGNSVVMGGNPYAQEDKLGPLVQRDLGSTYSVWPIATGGWTNVNEMVYMDRNPDVGSSATFFVWEYMSGGLSNLSRWRGDYVFPRTHPACASWYVSRRYLLPRILSLNVNELPPTGPALPEEILRFEATLTRLGSATGRVTPGVIFLYPTKDQYLAAQRGIEWLPERLTLERIARLHGLVIEDISKSPEWNRTLYRDGVHPTVQGNVVLAHILTSRIEDALKHAPDESGQRRKMNVKQP